jgi:hypothetical protein
MTNQTAYTLEGYRYGELLEATKVKRVGEAIGAACLTCGQVWTITDPVPWGWRKSQLMHRRGAPEHRTVMFRWKEVDTCPPPPILPDH